MCTVSMIGDHYRDKWVVPPNQTWPPPVGPYVPPDPLRPFQVRIVEPVSREEFDTLKREVEDMKSLLKRAKEYDERNGEPDCEMDEKMDVLRRVAKLVGVDLDDVLKP